MKGASKEKQRLSYTVFAVALSLMALFTLEKTLPGTSMLFTVLKKGAIYALVAVSMNLLNGFTGLFSLGQAGFMLVGAYTYAILTIPWMSKWGIRSTGTMSAPSPLTWVFSLGSSRQA